MSQPHPQNTTRKSGSRPLLCERAAILSSFRPKACLGGDWDLARFAVAGQPQRGDPRLPNSGISGNRVGSRYGILGNMSAIAGDREDTLVNPLSYGFVHHCLPRFTALN